MAGAPQWKVYDAHGKYQAACKEIEAAAAVVSFYGDGATIRYQHGLVVWTENGPARSAESYDRVAETAYQAIEDRRREIRQREIQRGA